jgi:dolichyl-diphosphooligosaccharide--protein glycosyltransferase
MYTHLLAGVQKGKLRRRMGRGNRSYALGTFVLIVVLATVLVYPPARDSGDSPVTIASASAGVRTRVPDWLEALEWLRLNTPEDAAIAAWWDYGYWISFIGERKSLADNGTINQTRIEQLATMFLSDEKTALEILEDLEAEYVAIFIVPFPLRNQQNQIQGYCFVQCIGTAGEEGKFVQMARIAGMNENRFINATGSLQPPFFDTFLGKLIPYDRQRKIPQGVDLYVRSEHYPTEPSEDFPLTLVFSSSHESIAEVVIYKIERSNP